MTLRDELIARIGHDDARASAMRWQLPPPPDEPPPRELAARHAQDEAWARRVGWR
jgi:hypothetical protein